MPCRAGEISSRVSDELRLSASRFDRLADRALSSRRRWTVVDPLSVVNRLVHLLLCDRFLRRNRGHSRGHSCRASLARRSHVSDRDSGNAHRRAPRPLADVLLAVVHCAENESGIVRGLLRRRRVVAGAGGTSTRFHPAGENASRVRDQQPYRGCVLRRDHLFLSGVDLDGFETPR